MAQVTLVGWCALLLWMTLVGCTDDQQSAVPPHDAGAEKRDASPAANVDASVDLHFLVIATLIEIERTLIARCPCLTAAGEYDSEAECLSGVSIGRNWVDCANRVDLTSDDSDARRENLRCNIAELSLRTECLSGSSCAQEAIAACMAQSLECPVLPYDVISKVVTECTIALSR